MEVLKGHFWISCCLRTRAFVLLAILFHFAMSQRAQLHGCTHLEARSTVCMESNLKAGGVDVSAPLYRVSYGSWRVWIDNVHY